MSEQSNTYIEYIIQQPCLICGYEDVQLYHINNNYVEYSILPICKLHHLESQTFGHDTFFDRHGIDVYKELFLLVSNYIDIKYSY